MEIDYYHLLGVGSNATRKEIKLAYRRMAEVYHPDKLRHLPPSVRKEGEDIMRLLNEAKTVLLDTDKRYLYDCRTGNIGSKQDAIIVQEFDKAVAYEPEYYIALEKEEVSSMMTRVLSGLREVFVRDKEFQDKIAIAQEIVEAKVIEERSFQIKTIEQEDGFEMIIENDIDETIPVAIIEEEQEEVEMTLHFQRITDEEKGGRSTPGKKNTKKKFKILAIEGEDDEEAEEDSEVEWED